MKEYTREEDEQLLIMLEMRALDNSAAQVAKHFGTTRNSIIGKLHRLKVDDLAAEGWDSYEDDPNYHEAD